MSKKVAYLISCSDHYAHRLHVTDDYLRSRGYDTVYVTSDFDHTSKQTFQCNVPGCVQIHARPYLKNLSLDRILSHREFARDTFRYLETLPQQPAVVVVLIPPNFLARYAAKYKKHHPEVKMIFDIFDLWPETFPFGRLKKLLAPVFRVWSAIRDRSLSAADFITTECDLFREKLKLPEEKSATVYLCAKPLEIPSIPVVLREDALDLCYLGAINNVIGIADICQLIEQLVKTKPVTLHIIGKGERQQEFIDAATAAGAEVIYYGVIYDDAEKQKILSRCHFGLNIMKSSVCVGLTMKSIEYFRFGLPIINNIPADTQRLVKNEGIGIQLNEECPEKISKFVSADFIQARINVQDMFSKCFSEQTVSKRYKKLISELM